MEPILFYYGLFILVSLLQLATSRVDNYGGWNNAPDTQYHIQTDEGDERYFKYQTKTGQYRKEKRLPDGTVVGTYGWVDPNGYLRLRDYIADNAGYRILKSRMMFVGDESDVGNSVAEAKHVPPSAGELVSPNSNPFSTYSVTANRAIYVPPLPANRNPFSDSQRIYVPPLPDNTQGTTPASTYRLLQNVGPQYFASSTPSPFQYTASTPQSIKIYSSSTPAPLHYYSSTPAPHYYSSSTPSHHYYASTPSPHFYSTSAPVHYYPSSTPQVDIHHNSEPKYNGPVYVSTTATPPTSTIRPIAVYSQTPRPIAVNYVSSTPETVTASPIAAIGYTASTPSPIERPAPIAGKFASNNNFITETEKNKYFFQHEQNRGYYKKRFVDYKPVDQEYDGISTVQNGFRYFLPKQYHEEQSSQGGLERTGSFGYVDPFGIRRVIYYNTSPGKGFVHRKNNRYVGLNAAPYDPRPT